jgi:DNA polymerase-3 subunit beta
MKFTCDRDILRKEIAVVANELIAPHHYIISLLENICLEANNDSLLIKAMETTFYFTARIPVNVLESG